MVSPLTRLLTVLLALAPLAEGSPRPQDGRPPATVTVEGLLERGIAFLMEGRTSEANSVFEQAYALDGESFRTHRWVLRSWMELGRSNETLTALDALGEDGIEGPVMDYLYGVAFALRAQGDVADGVSNSSVRMNFEDATSILENVMKEHGELFPDAWMPLAGAAWYTQNLGVSRRAADRAVECTPANPGAWMQRGRTAFSQFQSTRDPESVESADWGREAASHWRAARDSFARTVELSIPLVSSSASSGVAARDLLADAALQLGHVFVWRGQKAKAAGAYAEALAFAPERVDIAQVKSFLAPSIAGGPADAFHLALERGSHDFGHRYEGDARDATMLWWLGFSHYSRGDYASAERALVECLDDEPGFTNTWHYLGLARYALGKYSSAGDAFLAGWSQDPPAMLKEATDDKESIVPKLEYLASVAFGENKLENAATLNEMCAEAMKNVPRHWSNMGMLLRDAGDRLRRTEDPDWDRVGTLYNRSYVAYRRALGLVPDDPQVINDTAVILHYCLMQELDVAMQMYEEAIAIAERRLSTEGLTREERARFQTALDDASGNVPRLEALNEFIRKRDAEKETETGSS